VDVPHYQSNKHQDYKEQPTDQHPIFFRRAPERLNRFSIVGGDPQRQDFVVAGLRSWGVSRNSETI
jgi:hypothetical protein